MGGVWLVSPARGPGSGLSAGVGALGTRGAWLVWCSTTEPEILRVWLRAAERPVRLRKAGRTTAASPSSRCGSALPWHVSPTISTAPRSPVKYTLRYLSWNDASPDGAGPGEDVSLMSYPPPPLPTSSSTPAATPRSAQAGQQGEGNDRQQVFRDQERMRQAVVKRPEPAVHQVGLRRAGAKQEHAEAEKHHAAFHASALHKNITPATATAPPATRNAARPAGHW